MWYGTFVKSMCAIQRRESHAENNHYADWKNAYEITMEIYTNKTKPDRELGEWKKMEEISYGTL